MGPHTRIVFKDGYISPRSIPSKYFDKAILKIQAQAFGRPIAYFINVKPKENKA